MNLSPLWVPFLASHGFEAVHWATSGKPDAPDSGFFELAAAGPTHPSVIQVRAQDVLPSAIREAVLRAIRAAESHLEAGALGTVDPLRHRIRLLPI